MTFATIAYKITFPVILPSFAATDCLFLILGFLMHEDLKVAYWVVSLKSQCLGREKVSSLLQFQFLKAALCSQVLFSFHV